MKIIFVDGPEHGNTKNFNDSEPKPVIFMPEQHMSFQIENDWQSQPIGPYKYRYDYRGRTKLGTWIYEYIGRV